MNGHLILLRFQLTIMFYFMVEINLAARCVSMHFFFNPMDR